NHIEGYSFVCLDLFALILYNIWGNLYFIFYYNRAHELVKKYEIYSIDIFENIKYKIKDENKENIKIKSYNAEIDFNTSHLLTEIINLVDEINSFEILDKSQDEFYKASNKFSRRKILKDNFTMSSLKVSYSLKLAVVGTFGIFVVKYFNLLQGRWLAYTIFSLIQPYSEMIKIRAKERIKGTMIGVLIIVVLFTVVENNALRGIIILLAGYLNSYAKDYKNAMIIVTVSAVASVSILDSVISFGIQRIIFVVLGAVLSIIGNKYIMPYKIEDGNKEIEENYRKLIKTIDMDVNNDEDEHLIKSLYLIPSFFEIKLKSTNIDKKELEHLMKFSDENRVKINGIYRKHYMKKDKTYLLSNNKSKIAVSE
ncbi:MAG: FUSC family protein, partial [Sarcina sp.]